MRVWLKRNSGLNRITKNISLALPFVDDAFRYVFSTCVAAALTSRRRVTDSEAVSMSRYLVKHDGLFLGSSSACNLVACVKLIKAMDWGYADPYRNEDGEEKKVVVTILSVLFICVFACFDSAIHADAIREVDIILNFGMMIISRRRELIMIWGL